MHTNVNQRLEMFCDGVFAIAITLLILDIKVPPVEHFSTISEAWKGFGELWPSFFALVLGFTTIFIAWISHHNLLTLINKNSPQLLLANGYFLFTVILIPFSTAYVSEYLNTPFAQLPVLIYCINRLFHNTGWNLLHRSLVKPHSLLKDSTAIAIHKKTSRGAKLGTVLYGSICIIAWWLPIVALTLTVLTSVYWLYLGTLKKFAEV